MMNLAAEDIVSVLAQRDEKLQHAVPLKFVEQDGSYRFHAGKNFVTLRRTESDNTCMPLL